MEFVGADADFRPSPNSKPSAKRVLAFTITLAESTSRRNCWACMWSRGQDGIGVVAAVAVDVRNGFIHARHHLHADDRGQVFLAPVLLGRRHQLAPRHRFAADRQRLRAAARISTPLAANTAPIWGKTPPPRRAPPAGLRSRCRGCICCVLALSATFTAMAMSRGRPHRCGSCRPGA